MPAPRSPTPARAPRPPPRQPRPPPRRDRPVRPSLDFAFLHTSPAAFRLPFPTARLAGRRPSPAPRAGGSDPSRRGGSERQQLHDVVEDLLDEVLTGAAGQEPEQHTGDADAGTGAHGVLRGGGADLVTGRGQLVRHETSPGSGPERAAPGR